MVHAIWQQLSDIRILDLTNERGFLCGKVLADLGADVIKVEPPSGDASRHAGPFYHNDVHPEKSLYWFAYNCGKRGITLDLEKEEGKSLFKRLAAKADVIIDSFPLGAMERWGLDYDALSKLNPRLIYTSITPFGRTGPYSDYKVSDIVAMAMGDPLFLTGDNDRPPVRIGFPQAYLHAGAEAAAATMMALYQREMSGEGQLVDVSIQESLLGATFNAAYTWVTEKLIISRMGSARMIGKQLSMPQIWPCKDGFVSFTVLGGVSGGNMMKNLANWMEEESMGNEAVSGVDWGSFDFYGITTDMVARVSEPITRFFSSRTKEELFTESMKRGIMLFPVADADYIVHDPHLREKGFWQEIEHNELDCTIAYPRAPITIDGEYPSTKRRAPLIGEHNNEVYRELLNLSDSDVAALKERRVI